MRTKVLVVWALSMVLVACSSNTGTTENTTAAVAKIDPAKLDGYPVLALPFRTSFSGTDHKPVLVDSVKANELLLKKTPGCHEWVIIGTIASENWRGLIYDISVTDDFERIINLYDKEGNKTSEMVLITNASPCFGSDRDCNVEVVVSEKVIEVKELFTRYTTDAVEMPVERLETVSLYVINNGKIKRESRKERDLTGIMSKTEEENLSNKIVVYKDDEGHELRLEIMGQNHETLWYYDNGKTEIQVIPMIGENDYYSLLDNGGKNIGFMQLKKIDEENEFRIAEEIELGINADKQISLFKRSGIIK